MEWAASGARDRRLDAALARHGLSVVCVRFLLFCDLRDLLFDDPDQGGSTWIASVLSDHQEELAEFVGREFASFQRCLRLDPEGGGLTLFRDDAEQRG